MLGEEIEQPINEIKQMQDHLGELHDADVTCQLVRDFLMEWEKSQLSQPIAERQNPETIVNYLGYEYAERHRLMTSFTELWRKFSRPQFRQMIGQAITRL